MEQAGVIDLGLAQAGGIVEAFGVVPGQRGNRGGGRHQIREQGSTRQRVSAGARVAPRLQPVGAQLSADRTDIGGGVGDGGPGGAELPVAGPVVADEPQPTLGGIRTYRPYAGDQSGARVP